VGEVSRDLVVLFSGYWVLHVVDDSQLEYCRLYEEAVDGRDFVYGVLCGEYHWVGYFSHGHDRQEASTNWILLSQTADV
jgi:hypothetical protein